MTLDISKYMKTIKIQTQTHLLNTQIRTDTRKIFQIL